MKKLITLLTTLFLAGCGVFGIRTAKEPDYQLLKEEGAIQIRHYPELVVAVTEVKGDYKSSGNRAFQRLADYIFGNNRKQQKIAMTAPVMQGQQFETMAMTAPVLQQRLADQTSPVLEVTRQQPQRLAQIRLAGGRQCIPGPPDILGLLALSVARRPLSFMAPL